MCVLMASSITQGIVSTLLYETRFLYFGTRTIRHSTTDCKHGSLLTGQFRYPFFERCCRSIFTVYIVPSRGSQTAQELSICRNGNSITCK